MDSGMEHKARLINGVLALDDFVVLVDQDQIGQSDLRKMHRDGVSPIQFRALRVTNG